MSRCFNDSIQSTASELFMLEEKQIYGLIYAITPKINGARHLKLIAAFKFMAVFGIGEIKPNNGKTVEDMVPDYHKKIEEAIRQCLPAIMNGEIQIDGCARKIS